jgi:hypothetical protein
MRIEMEFIKLVISPHGRYSYNDASNIEMTILGHFLSSDVGCYSPTFRKWASHATWRGGSGNITMIEKEDGYIYVSDLYSEEQEPTELKMTVEQFIQLLDDWQEKVCEHKPREVIIKHESDQFVIETIS